MSIQKLERVMWRLRERNKNKEVVTNTELYRAIIIEIGTDPRTYKANRAVLMKLQWIKVYNSKKVTITDKDLTGD